MKIRIVLKDPDGVGDALQDAVTAELKKIEGISDDERELLRDSRQEQISDATSKFIEYGEYLGIEIDTDEGTARVLLASEIK